MSTETPDMQYKVWFQPRDAGEMFEVLVRSPAEGCEVLDVLADYDNFLVAQNIKADDSNCGGIVSWDTTEQEWIDLDEDELASLKPIDNPPRST